MTLGTHKRSGSIVLCRFRYTDQQGHAHGSFVGDSSTYEVLKTVRVDECSLVPERLLDTQSRDQYWVDARSVKRARLRD
jgi:hypothetical protein